MADQGARNNNVDEVLVLLEDVSKNSEEIRNENRALRLEIQKRDEEHKKAYSNLEKKLQDITNLCTSGNNRQTTRKARRRKDDKIIVPIQCRRVTKKTYSKLLKKRDDFHGFNTDDSFDSEDNSVILERVIGAVHHDNGGPEKCPWSPLAIEAVLQRYFLSLCEKKKRIDSHKYEDHKKSCRKSGRQRDKLSRRTAALERIDWDTSKKGKAAEILTLEAMSSEESCLESDGEGRTKVVKYKVRRLSWESRQMKKMKNKLDKVYRKSLSSRARDRILPREDDTRMSSREVPEEWPEWAIAPNLS